jgi:hypothetical protein
MVLNLQIGLWSGHRLDKDATRKVTEDAGAESDAARVNKHLVPKTVFKDITSSSNAVRMHFYEHTLPWKDNGDRLLTRTMYTRFIENHESLVATFEKAVDRFLTKGYPQAVEQAGFRMGDLFNVADYPAPRDLRRRFYINLDIDAVTEAGDFRVKMDKEQVDAVRTAMEQAMEQRIAGAMRDVWDRLNKVVSHLADKMGDEDKIFRNSTLANLEELVELLPGLNVLDDPDLERVRQDIKKTLCGLDPKGLRSDTAYRKEVGGEAKRIMDMMGGFMTAMGS